MIWIAPEKKTKERAKREPVGLTKHSHKQILVENEPKQTGNENNRTKKQQTACPGEDLPIYTVNFFERLCRGKSTVFISLLSHSGHACHVSYGSNFCDLSRISGCSCQVNIQ